MSTASHSHVFLGEGHDKNERRTWAVIALCAIMMVAEIVGGLLFGSIALVADGLHMSTHASALLLAALAYRYARRHAEDPRFSFGTGKLGDLAGFSSAIVLVMIAILIGYEAISRLVEIKGEYGVLPSEFCQAILKTIDETRQLLGEMEKGLLLDGKLPADLRDEIRSYNRKILAYSSDQIIPMRRPFGGRWFDDATVPRQMIEDCLAPRPGRTAAAGNWS